MWIVNLFFVP